MKLKINHKKKFGKTMNNWRLKNILLKNEWVNQEIKEEMKKYMEANENDNTTAQNLWDTAKVVIRGKYVAIQALLKKEEWSHTYNLTLHLKELEKEQQTSRRQEIIKIRAEIIAIETKKPEQIHETRKINKIDNH